MRPTGFMIDMDGTVYKGGRTIPGAPEFIGTLEELGIPFSFLTNNSSNTRLYYLEKLLAMGFDVTEEKILTSTVATARFISSNRKEKKCFIIATRDVENELISLGVKTDDLTPDIVILTFDRTITFEKINKAYHFMMAGAELIATHPDDLCPTEDSYDVDIGGFIRLLESLTGKKATVVGKPNPLMLEMAALEMGIDMKGAYMIGDRLYTDIRMANDAGIGSVMVLTGEASTDDLRTSDFRPDVVVGSVADIKSALCL